MHVAAAAADGDVLLFHNCNVTLMVMVRPKLCCFPILLFHYCLVITISCRFQILHPMFDVLKSDG